MVRARSWRGHFKRRQRIRKALSHFEADVTLRCRSLTFDWSSQYDQVAVMFALWGEPQPNGNGRNTKWLEVDTVDPKDLSIKRNKLWEFSAEDCGFDFTVGNFDRYSTELGGKSVRNPDLQLGLVFGSCGDGYKGLQIYDVDPQNGFAVSPHSEPPIRLPVPDSSSNITVSAGDTQGRSLYLGEPTKIVLDGTAQPTVVTAAPPMHVDFMPPITATTPEVLNLSVVPDGFFTTYDTDETSTTQSSTTNTSSWSFNSKETVGASVEFGSVKEGEGTEFSDTFTAAQDLKRSTESENESFSTHSFDISQQTGFSDQI